LVDADRLIYIAKLGLNAYLVVADQIHGPFPDLQLIPAEGGGFSAACTWYGQDAILAINSDGRVVSMVEDWSNPDVLKKA